MWQAIAIVPRTWKFHIVRNLVQTRKEFKWVLKRDQGTVFASDQTFDDKAAARSEIKRIKEAEIVED